MSGLNDLGGARLRFADTLWHLKSSSKFLGAVVVKSEGGSLETRIAEGNFTRGRRYSTNSPLDSLWYFSNEHLRIQSHITIWASWRPQPTEHAFKLNKQYPPFASGRSATYLPNQSSRQSPHTARASKHNSHPAKPRPHYSSTTSRTKRIPPLYYRSV